MNRWRDCLGRLLVLLATLAAPNAHAEALPVVATFSILADLAREVGGERVAVTSLVAPGGDAHGYHPSPGDARRIAGARLVLMNGLGFEGWVERLLASGEFRGERVIASAGVRELPLPGQSRPRAADPHAWQDPQNAKVYARNIAQALALAEPSGAPEFLARYEAFAERVDALDAELRARLAGLPPERRRVVTSHDAFAYLGRAYGLEFVAPRGIANTAQPSAAQVAQLIRQIRAERIPAVFFERGTDPRLLEQIAAETGARIGGTLYSDTLSEAGGEAPSYLRMMEHNLRTLVEALTR